MYNRIYSYLKQHNLLYEKQFGFQKNTSTEHAILELVESITIALTNKKVTLGVFIDLSKAFDTVNHEILLEKLQHYGIKGHTLKWLKSYITNRKQCICIENGSFTDLTDVICGVPQGSILGPLLFLIYVNDMPFASTKTSPIIFADDTNPFISDKSVENAIKSMNTVTEFNALYKPMLLEKLSDLC